MKRLIVLLACLWTMSAAAQQFSGMSGLIHVSSADMDDEGVARVGMHFINKHSTPDTKAFTYNGERYNTLSHYLSITPFKWVEFGYTCTLFKHMSTNETHIHAFEAKDRYISVKVRPLKEDRWWPSVAMGCADVMDSFSFLNVDNDSVESYFGQYYLATSKHFNLKGNVIGAHLAYRYYLKDYNSKWNGLVGGITFQPSFLKDFRLIAEYSGADVNVGFDWMLFKHFLLQASLQDGKYFSGGLSLTFNLL